MTDKSLIIDDILDGTFTKEKYPGLTDETIFKLAIDDILLECTGIKVHPNQRTLDTISKCESASDLKSSHVYSDLQKNLETGGLNRLLNFLTRHIANQTIMANEEKKKLISLVNHFITLYEVKITDENSKFSENDIVTSSNFLKFVTNLLDIYNISAFAAPELIHQKGENNSITITLGDPQEFDTLITNSIKLSETVIQKLNSQNYTANKETIMDMLKSLGQFGFELKIKANFQAIYHKIPELASKIIHSKTLNNFSAEDKELAGHIFLNGFDDGDENYIKLDCKDLLSLDRCPRPMTENIQLFQSITQGNYSNKKPPFTHFEQVENEIIKNIGTLDRMQSIRTLVFLKNVLKTNRESKFNFLNLDSVAFNMIKKLTKDLEERNNLDASFARVAENLSFFIFNLVKNNNNNQELYHQFHIIKRFSELYKNIICHAPYLSGLLSTMGNHLFNILAQNIDRKSALKQGCNDFIDIIQSINEVCSKNPAACNMPKILTLSFKCLGRIYHKKSVNYTTEVIAAASKLIKWNSGKLDSHQLNDAVSFFFKPNITQRDLNSKCKLLFNLTGCRPASLINLDSQIENEPSNDVIATTLRPKDSIIVPAQITAIPVNTNETLQTSNSTIAPLITTTTHAQAEELPVQFDNSTLTENSTALTNLDHRAHTPHVTSSAIELGASAAHGAGSGILNGIIQYFAVKYSQQEEQKSTTKAILLYSSLFAHASLAATFPLILFQIKESINQGNEEEAQQLWNNLLLQALPTFISSVGFSLGLQIINEFTQLLSNRFKLRSIAQNTLPLVGTAVSVIKNPLATGIQIGTSITASSLTYFGLNRLFPAKHRHSDLEAAEVTKSFEMEPLNKEKGVIAINGTIAETETLEKTYQYITEENFIQIKKQSEEILSKLENLVHSLNENIEKIRAKIDSDTIPTVADTYQKIIEDKSKVLQIIQRERDCCRLEVSFLQDNHSNAYQKYRIETKHTSEQKKETKALYTSAMEKLGNVFKRMEPMFNNMKSNLGKAEGYIIAASNSFAGSDQTKDYLNEIMGQIQFPLSLTKLYLNTYSTSQAAEQGEKRGAKKALSNQKFFQKISADMSNHQRPKRTRQFSDNRCQSASDSKTHSSSSEESSVISTGSSKDSENAQIFRSLLNS
ncbi:MAG: hypothetical protein PHH73_02545 [Candidatus Rickettsiella isopodorum]|jgi:hypothetical protein|nr:hypothetical protein [Candidatus Rickettsiella isopodorum]MDD5162346.1 hypothetical protein [Candidatus Rickettsiella isopodorum]MDQ5900221.1 hypothetical protein [Pseudomonadota bacterium]